MRELKSTAWRTLSASWAELIADTRLLLLWAVQANKPIARDTLKEFWRRFKSVSLRWLVVLLLALAVLAVVVPRPGPPPPPPVRDCGALLAQYAELCGCNLGNGGLILRARPEKTLWGVVAESRVGRQVFTERRLAECGPDAPETRTRRPTLLVYSYFSDHERKGTPTLESASGEEAACLDALLENDGKDC